MTISRSDGIPFSQPHGIIHPWVSHARNSFLGLDGPFGKRDSVSSGHCYVRLFDPTDPGTLEIVPSLKDMAASRELRLPYLIGTKSPVRPLVQAGFDVEPAPLLKGSIKVLTYPGMLNICPIEYCENQGRMLQRWIVELVRWL
jgi:hypothetical protein